MKRRSFRSIAFGALVAVVVVSGQGVTALGQGVTPLGDPPTSPAKAQSGEKLILKNVITDPDGSTHSRYTRTFDGLRVIGGDLVSHRDQSGQVESIDWNASQTVAVPSKAPRLSLASAEAAGAKGVSTVQRSTATRKGELVVYNGGATPKLAYDVLSIGLKADQTPSKLHTITDASTGATLLSYDEIENGTGNGNGVFAGSVPLSTTAGSSYSMIDTVGNVTTDLNGATSGTGTVFTDADDLWGDGTVSDRASAGVDAHYGAQKTFDFYKNVLGRNGIWNNGIGARSRVHYGNSYVNAFWDGSQMTYGDGSGNTHPLVELDVAGHEMSHGLTQATAGLAYNGDAGGLNEGTSDIFGTAVEWYANNAADNPDYLIGELINLRGNGTPLRYMDRPSRDGRSPDCWSSSLAGLDPHYSSGPLNHWFYLASEGSGAKTVNGVAYDSPTCNASTVTGIGRDAAEKIWYRTLSTYLTSNSNYAAAREGAIKSAKDLYGGTSAQCAGVESSFAAIGVPAGEATCGAAPPPPPPSSNALLNGGFESGAANWTATNGVIGPYGAYYPTRSGAWVAWMSGYGTTHTDSISQNVTIPAGTLATLSYYVHIGSSEPTTGSPMDTMTVRAGSKVLHTLTNLNAAPGYQLKTADLSAYGGQTISLTFTGVENSSRQTSFLVDDTSVALVSTAPRAPRSAMATPGNGQASVLWTAPENNGGSPITAYTVTASPGGRTATTTGATTAMVTGLTNGTGYTFTVTATNAIGTSSASPPSASVIPKAAPSAPTGVVATGGIAKAVVSWTAAGNGGSPVTRYTVTANPGGRTATTTGATSATVTDLAPDTTYTFTVTATNAIGTSPASQPSTAVTTMTTPTAPTAAVATRGAASAVVSWTAPASNGRSPITRYTVRASPGDRTVTSVATTATVTGLANNTTYTFTVTATNAVGTSPASQPSTAVTTMASPTAPTDVLATRATTNAVVSWAAPVSNGGASITRYTVTASPGGRTVTTTGATTATVTLLSVNTIYTFTVTATNVIGSSTASTPALLF
jgi:Zn-dependent metalloprotease